MLAAGIPNITGKMPWAGVSTNPDNAEGALFASNLRRGYTYNTSTPYYAYDLNLDASLSNTIYGKSEIVQPPAIQLLPQIKF